MGKKNDSGARAVRYAVGSVLTQTDANEFRLLAKKYGKANTVSKAKARKKLKSLGIHTEKGNISRRYG